MFNGAEFVAASNNGVLALYTGEQAEQVLRDRSSAVKPFVFSDESHLSFPLMTGNMGLFEELVAGRHLQYVGQGLPVPLSVFSIADQPDRADELVEEACQMVGGLSELVEVFGSERISAIKLAAA